MNSFKTSLESTPTPVRVRSIEPVAVGWSTVYQANHQVQYLQLQAELDTLLLKLQMIERQRSVSLAAR